MASNDTIVIAPAPHRVYPTGSGSTKVLSRSGHEGAPQIAYIGEIQAATVDSFRLEGMSPFNIKNEGDDAVSLSVRLAGMPADTFVTTTFYPGWNPEIVIEITGEIPSGLKYGL